VPDDIAPPLRVLIVDDEPLARDCVRLALRDAPDIEVLDDCRDGTEAVRAIRRVHPDVMFLDVQMPGADGFAVIEQIGADRMPAVVFVTAFDTHAIRAFEVHALDYVLKPFENERLLEALERARERFRSRQDGELARRLAALVSGWGGDTTAASSHGSKRFVERFTVRHDDRIRFVDADDIEWIEADGNYAVLHTAAEAHRIRLTLQTIDHQLDPRRFARIHRSTIVNLACVREIQPWFGGDYIAILHGGRKLRVSRTRAGPLLKPMR
jgi:two-component system LytT family response regulator